jgi:hypothetical protein
MSRLKGIIMMFKIWDRAFQRKKSKWLQNTWKNAHHPGHKRNTNQNHITITLLLLEWLPSRIQTTTNASSASSTKNTICVTSVNKYSQVFTSTILRELYLFLKLPFFFFFWQYWGLNSWPCVYWQTLYHLSYSTCYYCIGNYCN